MSTGKSTSAASGFRKMLSLFGYALSFVCGFFVPRRAGQWAFGSWIGVGEGPLAVARELRASDPAARIFWIVGDEAEAATAAAEGFTPALRQSWAGFWATLTARHIVISHGYNDVNRFGIGGASIAHLGHGVPLKRLHHHIAVLTDGPGFVRSVLRRVYRIGTERVQLYV
ncbi:MAG: glycosyl/glycerophosphate transferase, partial [Leucobacter sp.]